MDEKTLTVLIANMTDNLPTLRKKLDLSQEELARMLNVSRVTINSVESKKRPMSWSMFLSLILIFSKNKETDKLLTVFEIYTDELNDMIKNRESIKEENHGK